MPAKTLDEFMARYNAEGQHPVIEVNGTRDADGNTPFIVIRHGDFTVIVNPLSFDDHLCIDLHSFVGGQNATAGVFGMSAGYQYPLGITGTTSHGWNSANLVSVLVGEQARKS